MKIVCLLFVLIFTSISCGNIKTKEPKCIFFVKDLTFMDSSRVVVTKSRTPNMQDVFEKGDSTKNGSLYQFDANKQLRFYAFIYNDSNAFLFSIKYDSLGNIVKKTGGDVVSWFAEKHGSDSIDVTFLLYPIGMYYSMLTMKVGNDSFKNIKLFKSKIFSNLIGGMITVPSSKVETETFYLFGIKRNYCTKTSAYFKDSVLIELPSYKAMINSDK